MTSTIRTFGPAAAVLALVLTGLGFFAQLPQAGNITGSQIAIAESGYEVTDAPSYADSDANHGPVPDADDDPEPDPVVLLNQAWIGLVLDELLQLRTQWQVRRVDGVQQGRHTA